MSAAAWMRRQRDRPLTEHERRTAFVATAALLIAAAPLFANTRPLVHNTPARTAIKTMAPTAPDPSPPKAESSADGELSPVAARTSRAFLAGYLAYTCGGAPASQITSAARSLIASLQAHPPRVPPAMRASRPRVVELHPTTAPSGELGVSAVINDGGLIDYTIGLTLAPEGGRLFVSALEQD